MSNPTELPDLDKLLVDYSSAAVNYSEHGDIGSYYNDLVGAENAIRELVARRAQPEGEAKNLRCDPSVGFFICGDSPECAECQPEGEDRCVICGSTEPRTGTCGSDDPRALCKAPAGKPEGEAPQAGLPHVAALMYHALNDAYQGGIFAGEDEKLVCAALAAYNRFRSAPAAQHAESGTPTTDQRAGFEAWHHRHFGLAVHRAQPLHGGNKPGLEYWSDYTNDSWAGWQAALAAQSQGACLYTQDEAERLARHTRDAALERVAQQAAAPGAEPVAVVDEGDDGLFVDIIYGPDGSALKRGDKLYLAVHSAPGTPEAPQTAAARDVLAERQRQVEQEGWTPAHDDKYRENELPRAASAYTLGGKYISPPAIWPWTGSWWKPLDARSNYVRAGALLLAEIERLDRAAQLDGGQGEGE